ncbi:MAG: O-antigen ligase family protein [Proteocatella sp.]
MNWLAILLFIDAGMGTSIPFNNIYGNFSIIDIVVILGILLYGLKQRKKIHIRNESFKIATIYFLFAICQLIAIILAQNNMLQALGPVARNIYYALLFVFLAPAVDDYPKYEFLIKAFILGISINMLNVLYLWSLNKTYIGSFMYLNNGLINRNVVYYYSVISIVFINHIINISKMKSTKYLFGMVLILVTIVSLLTFSKGAWLLLIVAYILSLRIAFIKSSIARKIIILITLISMGVLINYYGISSQFYDTKVQNYSYEEDARLDYKIFALETAIKHPMGIGPKNYKEYTSKYAPHPSTTDPHDAALTVLVDSGIIAFMLYIYLQYIYIKKIIKFKMNENKLKLKYITSGLLINCYIVYFLLSLLTGMVFTSKLSLVVGFLIISSSNIQKNYIMKL